MQDQDNPRLREILAQAADLPPEQRGVYLDGACEEDEALRREVESLLGHLEHGHRLLEDVTAAGAGLHADLPQALSAASAADGPGSRIGRYKLLQLIGEGGFGTVFMAEQEHPVRRRVALKIIKLGMDSKQVIARFEAERQALAMMDHPNIARVLDGGTTDTGRPYFVMDLVKGVPITEYCDGQNLPARQRLELFAQVCQAVQHAHQKGIIHRDLKPSNILVSLADGTPVPKVIDFGIAKATNARLTEQTYFTEFRQFIGTPQYMSPEQAEMSAIDIDTRSDIYSLGVLLYELLTGTTPLAAKSLRSAAYEQMRQMIRETQPPRPSTRLSTLGDTANAVAKQRSTEPHKLGQLLRGELDWIVMKALEKDRTRRYDTATGLAMDIQRHLSNEPVLARPPSRMYTAQKFVSRHWVGAMAGSAVATALVIGLALATYGLVRAKAERDRANTARIEAQTQRDIADKERLEAKSEKEIADEQRQLATDNAKRANANARNTEVRFAQGLVAQADALTVARRFADAQALYADAYGKLGELNEPLISAETGLCNLYHQAAFPLLTFTGHRHEVWAVAITPDGKTALSGCLDGTLKLWDLAWGKELRTLTGHKDAVFSIAIAADGQTAMSASWDKTLKLWDLTNGKELRTFEGHTDHVGSVALHQDSRTALSASDDKTLKLWDLATGRVLRTFADADYVNSVAFSQDGRTALSGGHDKLVKLWDLASGDILRTFTGHTGGATCVAFMPGGQTALSGSFDHSLKLWDVNSGKEIRAFAGHSGVVNQIAIAPDGKTALSGSDDRTLKLWDLATGIELCTFAGHTDFAQSVSIAPDGQTALSGGDTTLRLWDLAGGKRLGTLEGHAGGVGSVALSPDGRMALSGGADKTLKLWDLATGRELRVFAGHTSDVNSVAISPDGRAAVSGSSDHTLKLWDLSNGREIRAFAGHKDAVRCVAISPDGRTALSSSADETLKLWDLASGRELRSFAGHSDWIWCVAFAPDGQTAISASSDQTLKLWNLSSGKEIRTLTRHIGGEVSVAIAPDGRTALSGGVDDTVNLWDIASGTILRTFKGHMDRVRCVAFAPDGLTAVSGGADHTIRLWDLANGKEIRTFAGHLGAVTRVAFAPRGRTVVSCSEDGTVMTWDFDRGPTELAYAATVPATQAKLQQSPDDPSALLTLGQWFAFRGASQKAVECLTSAREHGAAVAPLMLARCYWKSGRLPDARREFEVALEQSKDQSERTYLSWCIAAIDAEPRPETRPVGHLD